MSCPVCHIVDHTCVLNTVHLANGLIRRRRGCRACQVRWTTYEDIEPGSLINAFVPRPVVGEGLPRPELPVRGALIPDDGHLEFGGKDVLNAKPSLDE